MAEYKYDKIVIAFDQSYTATGFSLAADNQLKICTSLNFKGLKTKSQKRREVSRVLGLLLIKNAHKAKEVVVHVERIRTFNNAQRGGAAKGGGFGGINPNYMKATGALIGTIVDTAAEFGVPVYSIDTRSWKSQVVGSSKARKTKDGKRDAKGETIEFVERLGFDMFIRTNKNGKDLYDDDAADSGCIALYGFIPKSNQKLKIEE